MNTSVSPDTPLSRNQHVVTTEVDGELMMMSVEEGFYYNLDPIASEIWNLLEVDRNAGQICDQMMKRYDVDRNQCLNDITAFLTEMIEEKLIRVT